MLLLPEVVDHILSFLQTDITTLKSCSQAHPLLSGPAERYIYYTITVDIKPGGDADIGELARRLSDNPRVRNHVRILKINVFESIVSELTTVVKATLSILSSLPVLRSVTIASRPYTTWVKIHKKLQLAFVDILLQSSVRAVHIEGLTFFPLSVFDSCQHVKTLSLCHCPNPTSSVLASTWPPLESLSIQDFGDRTLDSWAINHVGHLTSLKVGAGLQANVESFSAFPKLLEACSTSLTSLELDVHKQGVSYPQCAIIQTSYLTAGRSEDFPETFDTNIFGVGEIVEFPFSLSVLPHLEHLTIWTILSAVQSILHFKAESRYRVFCFHSAIPAIARLIEESASSLRQVVLGLYCEDFSNLDNLISFSWEPLILLGQSPTCPHIEIRICCREFVTRIGFSPREITDSLAGHARLMELVKRDVFSVKPMTLDDWNMMNS